jgi:hypothetical protein
MVLNSHQSHHLLPLHIVQREMNDIRSPFKARTAEGNRKIVLIRPLLTIQQGPN